MKQSNINHKPTSQKYKMIPMKIIFIISIIIIIYHQPLNDLSKVTARKETKCDDFHILERISSTIWTNRKAMHPTHINFVGALLLTHRPNTLNYGLLLKSREIYFMDVKEGIFFLKSMHKCKKVKSWNVSWVGDSEREASITLHVYREVLCSERFWWILEHHDNFFLIFYTLKSGDADADVN